MAKSNMQRRIERIMLGGELLEKEALATATNTVIEDSTTTKVVVTDISMHFDSMVVFMLKWLAASVIAALLLCIPFFVLFAIFRA
jgi:hypothetical protein